MVRLACERPDPLGRSLSPWDCTELARQLVADGLGADISAATVRRILAAHQLNPRRQHVWLYPKQPRDAAFYDTVSELIDLYTRPLRPDELVLSVDEKTSLQPRPRCAPTLPAQPRNRPNQVEHEYKRAGALNLFAAFDTRSGKVYGYLLFHNDYMVTIPLNRSSREVERKIYFVKLSEMEKTSLMREKVGPLKLKP